MSEDNSSCDDASYDRPETRCFELGKIAGDASDEKHKLLHMPCPACAKRQPRWLTKRRTEIIEAEENTSAYEAELTSLTPKLQDLLYIVAMSKKSEPMSDNEYTFLCHLIHKGRISGTEIHCRDATGPPSTSSQRCKYRRQQAILRRRARRHDGSVYSSSSSSSEVPDVLRKMPPPARRKRRGEPQYAPSKTVAPHPNRIRRYTRRRQMASGSSARSSCSEMFGTNNLRGRSRMPALYADVHILYKNDQSELDSDYHYCEDIVPKDISCLEISDSSSSEELQPNDDETSRYESSECSSSELPLITDDDSMPADPNRVVVPSTSVTVLPIPYGLQQIPVNIEDVVFIYVIGQRRRRHRQ